MRRLDITLALHFAFEDSRGARGEEKERERETETERERAFNSELQWQILVDNNVLLDKENLPNKIAIFKKSYLEPRHRQNIKAKDLRHRFLFSNAASTPLRNVFQARSQLSPRSAGHPARPSQELGKENASNKYTRLEYIWRRGKH